jgi:hypothetical protein
MSARATGCRECRQMRWSTEPRRWHERLSEGEHTRSVAASVRRGEDPQCLYVLASKGKAFGGRAQVREDRPSGSLSRVQPARVHQGADAGIDQRAVVGSVHPRGRE